MDECKPLPQVWYAAVARLQLLGSNAGGAGSMWLVCNILRSASSSVSLIFPDIGPGGICRHYFWHNRAYSEHNTRHN